MLALYNDQCPRWTRRPGGWRRALPGRGGAAALQGSQRTAVAIRRLSPTQAVLAGGLPSVGSDDDDATGPLDCRWLCAPDGAGLWRLLRDVDMV